MLVFAQEAGNYYGSFNAGFVAKRGPTSRCAGVFVTSAILGCRRWLDL
jgi:hypothetical protein